ncbi:hypothetical protein BpHYR1_018490 [Brachionus plicatilis]|uniref:Uncharacterized protein n=1 Tax=Brachionus plicatilis TaxID=10195 RepID=A0A3M7SSV8_BRAPC|nr:hypothetical protein BpHYR1_018490 [Brachionus plicatilis]
MTEFLFNLCLKFTIPSQSKFNFVSPHNLDANLIIFIKNIHENSEIRRILVYFRTDSQKSFFANILLLKGPTKILTPAYLTNQKYF